MCTFWNCLSALPAAVLRTPRAAAVQLFPIGLCALLFAAPGWALPSFARQTGVACAQCHTLAFGPALTPFGRNFKLNAYALSEQKSLPLSAMLIASFNQTARKQPEAPPHFDDNDNAAVDEVSAFFAGRIADHLGAFAQVTYSGIERHTAWDNLDVRYADHFKAGHADVLLGVTLNNNPTVQDVWNSTPAWAFPFASSELVPAPSSVPQIDGAFAQQSLGMSLYALVNDLVYVEVGGYRTLGNSAQKNLGVEDPAEEDRIDGTAPYWRIALQRTSGSHYGSLGIFGFAPQVHPGGESGFGKDRYQDFGYDATYQYANSEPHTFNANATFIHESQTLAASTALGSSDSSSNHLDELRLNGQYAYQQTYAVSFGYLETHGSRNAARYTPEPVVGSESGRPDTRAYVSQLEWVPLGKLDSSARPWGNLRLGLQYTRYSRFNGGTSNYDGFGRSARDNDTLFLFAWTAL